MSYSVMTDDDINRMSYERRAMQIVAAGHVPDSQNHTCVKCHENVRVARLKKCARAHMTVDFDGPFFDCRTGNPL